MRGCGWGLDLWATPVLLCRYFEGIIGARPVAAVVRSGSRERDSLLRKAKDCQCSQRALSGNVLGAAPMDGDVRIFRAAARSGISSHGNAKAA
jgi:hypothetical protein